MKITEKGRLYDTKYRSRSRIKHVINSLPTVLALNDATQNIYEDPECKNKRWKNTFYLLHALH